MLYHSRDEWTVFGKGTAMIGRKRLLSLTREVVSPPTTSFHEHRVLGLLERHARSLGLPAAQDRWGNLHVRYQRGGRKRRWVLVAHTDHPGFVVVEGRGRRCRGHWFGRVERAYFRGTRVLIHGDAGVPVRGKITSVRVGGPRKRVQWLRIETESPVSPGAVGTWDLPPFELRGDRIRMRAADDLAGCALLAALLESLVADRRNASVEVVYTRAEEAGLLGSTVLAQSGYLSHDDPILVVETSRELPSARIGKGPVLRLGDLMSVFDPGLARLLHLAALDLAREHRGFRFQRTLMDGGTCESSSYIAFGYRATGIALPLANYHNMGSKRIAAEEVSAADLVHALTLLEGLVTRPWPARGWPAAADRKPLVSLLRPAEARLRNSVTDPPHDWKDPA